MGHLPKALPPMKKARVIEDEKLSTNKSGLDNIAIAINNLAKAIANSGRSHPLPRPSLLYQTCLFCGNYEPKTGCSCVEAVKLKEKNQQKPPHKDEKCR